MAVKSKSKAKTTEFEKLLASYAERVNNGELTPLKVMQYREFGDDKGYFIAFNKPMVTKVHQLVEAIHTFMR